MKTISTKSQLALIGSGYAAVLALSGVAVYSRQAFLAAHPADVLAASGMYAAGDMMLQVFVTFLLMVPTVFLVRVLSKFEIPARVYSKTLFAVGLSAPLALGVYAFGETLLPPVLGVACFVRLLASPLFVTLMFFSRIVAKFQLPKRLTSYALVSEGASLCVSVAWLALAMTSGS